MQKKHYFSKYGLFLFYVTGIHGEISKSTLYGLWPVNDSSEVEKASSGSHWSLLVFSRPDNKFIHFDSWGGSNEYAARKLYQKLLPLISPDSDTTSLTFHSMEDCCAQDNGRDCGLHVLGNARHVLEFVNKSHSHDSSGGPLLWNNGLTTIAPKQAADMRKELLDLIETLATKK